MSNLFQLEDVRYICCCGSLKPIAFIYFCRHCLRLRCPYCVSHEVDSCYCGNCSENMPSAEAKQKKNRCGTCYDCPSCGQTASIRATTLQIPSDEDPSKPTIRKLHYLACGFCKWNSRDAGLPDTLSATEPWKEPENCDAKQVSTIADYLRVIGVKEKASKEKKFVHKSKYLAAGRHGLAHLLPKRYPVSTVDDVSKELPLPTYIAPTLGVDKVPELSDEWFDSELVVAKITNLTQRLSQVDVQPRECSQLLPMHKQLLIKRSLRCRVCERNISKPEYSPASIKFKIQLNAFYHVPQVRLSTPLAQPLKPGESTKVTLKLSNPSQFPTSIKFLPFSHVPLKTERNSTLPRESSTDVSLPSNLPTPSTSLTICSSGDEATLLKEVHVLPIRNEHFINNCHLVTIPTSEIILAPRDETSDFDDPTDTPDYQDDPTLVPWRRANKVCVILEVSRSPDSPPDDESILGLSIEYDYVNTISAMENKSSQGPAKLRLQTHVLINLASISHV